VKQYQYNKSSIVADVWQAKDFAIDEELFASSHLFSWRKVPLWLTMAVFIGIFLGLAFWNQLQEHTYRSELSSTSQWITQEIQLQSNCFQQATDTTMITACSQATARAIQQQQQIFQAVTAPNSLKNSAATMNNAFSALEAASCYDPTTNSSDSACLVSRDIRLHLVSLNIQDAMQH